MPRRPGPPTWQLTTTTTRIRKMTAKRLKFVAAREAWLRGTPYTIMQLLDELVDLAEQRLEAREQAQRSADD